MRICALVCCKQTKETPVWHRADDLRQSLRRITGVNHIAFGYPGSLFFTIKAMEVTKNGHMHPMLLRSEGKTYISEKWKPVLEKYYSLLDDSKWYLVRDKCFGDKKNQYRNADHHSKYCICEQGNNFVHNCKHDDYTWADY